MDDREKEVKKRKQPSGDSRAVPPAPVVKPRKRIIRRTRSRIAEQMGLADAPMMLIATLTDAEPILVASVAQKLPITDKTAIPFARGTKLTITDEAAILVTRGTKLTNTDEAAIPVAGGQQLPVTPRIHHQWIIECVEPCEGCAGGSILGWIGHCTPSEQLLFASYHSVNPMMGHAIYTREMRNRRLRELN